MHSSVATFFEAHAALMMSAALRTAQRVFRALDSVERGGDCMTMSFKKAMGIPTS